MPRLTSLRCEHDEERDEVDEQAKNVALSVVTRFGSLTHLSCPIVCDDLGLAQLLSALPNLVALGRLDLSRLGASGWQVLASQGRRLKSLRLRMKTLSLASGESLARLSTLHHVDVRFVERVAKVDAWMELWAPGLRDLESLGVHNIWEHKCPWAGAALQLLSPTLTSLATNCVLEASAFAHLGTFVRLTALSLTSASELDDQGLQFLAAMPDLRSLELCETKSVRGDGLAYAASPRRLAKLVLRGENLQDLYSLARFDLLASLSVVRVQSRWHRWIADRLSLPHHLARCLRNMVDLEHLDFSPLDTPIDDGDLENFARLRRVRNLEFRCSRISGPGLVHLSRLGDLRGLCLSASTFLTDAAFEHLVQLRVLERLDLSHCPQITDQGIARLAACRALGSVDLSATQITGAGLSEWHNLTTLWRLDISGCPNMEPETAITGLARMHSLIILDWEKGKELDDNLVRTLLIGLPRVQLLYLSYPGFHFPNDNIQALRDRLFQRA